MVGGRTSFYRGEQSGTRTGLGKAGGTITTLEVRADRPGNSLSDRALSMLRAVRDGRAQFGPGPGADLYVDGIHCCDQEAPHSLAGLGLIRPAGPAVSGERVSAIVTDLGMEVLDTAPSPARS
jgi:hypothetical protein